jgi:hypothetical protein
MKLNRRDCLRLGAAAGVGALLSGCSQAVRRFTTPALPATLELPSENVDPITRIVNRVSFGPTPGEITRVAALGLTPYVEQQLHPGSEESLAVTARLRGLEAFEVGAGEVGDLRKEEILRQMQMAAIIYAVYSVHQLRERMVDFWTNHFNIFAHKGLGAFLKPSDELKVIRANALGKFPDLLRASAHSPAMLSYLDNQVNRSGVANENYARELMELHTLGVHGGYTQKDVQEVARCFTGWTVEEGFLKPRGKFKFDPDLHDDGPKVVLGHNIPAGRGKGQGDMVLDILERHPSTARFIASKLCRYFLGDAADTWIERTAQTYLQTNGDIKAMLRPILLSQELLDSPPIMKRPFDFMVSALRAFNADTDGNTPLQEYLARIGQPLYQWPMPDGYPDRTAAWTGSLLARWNFGLALLSGGIAGTSVDIPAILRAAGAKTNARRAEALAEVALARRADLEAMQPLCRSLREHMDRAPVSADGSHPLQNETAALALASPLFQWR